jgi:tRNA G18 (ribose-2'-O)-methylase SpoU
MGKNTNRTGVVFGFEGKTLPYNPNTPRNVVDHLKWTKQDNVLKTIQKDKIPISILLHNIERDNNIGNIIRSATTFGVSEILLYGRKKFDRRTSVGAEFFMQFRHLRFIEELEPLKSEFDCIIGLEQTQNSIDLKEYQWDTSKRYLIIVGHEGQGLTQEALNICHKTIEIEQYGTTRSLNVSVATGILLYDYRLKNNKT